MPRTVVRNVKKQEIQKVIEEDIRRLIRTM